MESKSLISIEKSRKYHGEVTDSGSIHWLLIFWFQLLPNKTSLFFHLVLEREHHQGAKENMLSPLKTGGNEGRGASEVKPAGFERTTPSGVLLAVKFGGTVTLSSAGMGKRNNVFVGKESRQSKTSREICPARVMSKSESHTRVRGR